MGGHGVTGYQKRPSWSNMHTWHNYSKVMHKYLWASKAIKADRWLQTASCRQIFLSCWSLWLSCCSRICRRSDNAVYMSLWYDRQSELSADTETMSQYTTHLHHAARKRFLKFWKNWLYLVSREWKWNHSQLCSTYWKSRNNSKLSWSVL